MHKIFRLTIYIILISTSFTRAQPRSESISDTSLSINSDEIKTLLDAQLNQRINSAQIPGAVVIIVKNGQIFFSKGYGYSNLETKTPVTPDRTLFYTGSVTKPFTATAVMQLVEQGKLDLHTDVNTYLKEFQIPSKYTEPVTLAHLLTHTGGFDDINIGYVVRTAQEVRPLGQYLATDLPDRVMPPGTISSYSNHGYGLAGYLVELASEQSYADYIEEHIMSPLGMATSTAHLPPPPDLITHLATGYDSNYQTNQLNPAPLGFRQIPPAGSISVTGNDMAKFMIAHLQHGAYASGRILQTDTAEEMHKQQFTHHDSLAGMAYGLFERFRGNIRSLEHAGGFIGFSTYMTLVPEKQLGVFVAINKTAGGSSQIAGTLLNLFYPESSDPSAVEPMPIDNSHQFTGTYQWTRYSRQSIEKVAIWDSPVKVSVLNDRRLILQPTYGPSTEWYQIEPMLFRQVDQQEFLAFRSEGQRITHLFYNRNGSLPVALEKLAWYDDVSINRPAGMAMLLIFIATCLLWPLVIFIQKIIYRYRPPKTKYPGHPIAALIAGLTGLLNLLFFLGLDTWLGNSGYRLQLIYGMTEEMEYLLWLPLIVLPLTIGMIYWTTRAWQYKTRTPIFFELSRFCRCWRRAAERCGTLSRGGSVPANRLSRY